MSLTRRRFMAQGSAGLFASWTCSRGANLAAPDASRVGKPLRVAAIVTSFTYRSHAHVILENFLEDYLFNGERTSSGCRIESLYLDQVPEGDMGRQVAADYKIPIFPTIDAALTLGGKKLEVDGVLSIGEHGDYPINAKGQMEYPRKRFFDEIVKTFERTGHTAPVFNDKHLSYRWDWAKEMFDTAKRMNFALMAGSSVPLAERRPPLELPKNAKIEEAVSIHGGGVESYDFHALEVLQAMVEARAGGETGVETVEFLEGEQLWKAGKEGRWSIEMADAARKTELGDAFQPLEQVWQKMNIHGILLKYRDGLKAAALKVGDSGTRWNFSCRLANDPQIKATSFYVGPWENRNLFRALSHAIQLHFRNKRSPYPVERTLLTTGVLDAAMDSRQQHKPISTPWLEIAYQAVDTRPVREMGASWKLITEDMPQPMGIHRYFSS